MYINSSQNRRPIGRCWSPGCQADSRPTGEVSHKPISELPVLSARPAVTFPDSQRRGLWSGNWHVRERTAGDWTCEPQIANPVIRLLRHVPRYLRYLHAHYNKFVGPPYSRTKIYAARMPRCSRSYRLTSAAGLRPTSAANPPATAASVDRRVRGTDGQTDGRTLDHSMTLTAQATMRTA